MILRIIYKRVLIEYKILQTLSSAALNKDIKGKFNKLKKTARVKLGPFITSETVLVETTIKHTTVGQQTQLILVVINYCSTEINMFHLLLLYSSNNIDTSSIWN